MTRARTFELQRLFQTIVSAIVLVVLVPLAAFALSGVVDQGRDLARVLERVEAVSSRLVAADSRMARLEIALEKVNDQRFRLSDAQREFDIRDIQLQVLENRLDQVENALRRGMALPEGK